MTTRVRARGIAARSTMAMVLALTLAAVSFPGTASAYVPANDLRDKVNEKYLRFFGYPNQTVGPDGIPGPDGTPDGQGAFAWNGGVGIYAHRVKANSWTLDVAAVYGAIAQSWAAYGWELGKGYPTEDEHYADSWDQWYGCRVGDRAQFFSPVGGGYGWLACWNSSTGVRWHYWEQFYQ